MSGAEDTQALPVEFPNHGIFYERVVNRILDDLSERVSP